MVLPCVYTGRKKVTEQDKQPQQEKPKPLPNTVHDLLSVIQSTLKAPKSQYNKFGEFYYRDAEDILEAAKPLLPEGASFQDASEIVMIGDRFYAKWTAGIYFNDCSISAQGFAREPSSKKGMDEMQITGAAFSYARKTAYSALFAIDDAKDSDKTNKAKPEKPAAKDPVTHLGGSMRSNLTDGDQLQMYKQGLESLEGCMDLASLQKVWGNYNKTRKAFTDAQFADLLAKKDEMKQELSNGVH